MNKIDCEQYILSVGNEHRKRYAQYFSPLPIACFMRNWICQGKTNVEIFDPAFGLGAFFDDCPSEIHFSGMEVDRRILDFYKSHVSSEYSSSIIYGDYLLHFGSKYPNIICNPPYLKFQKFGQKETVLDEFKKRFSVVLSGYTNIASAFLVKSMFELAEGGRLAYIMPSEFLNTGYGRQIKELFIQKKYLAHVIRIECEQDAFPDATTSLCILLLDSAQPHDNLSFYSITKLDELDSILDNPVNSIPYHDLRVEEKWGSYFEKNSITNRFVGESWVELSAYGHFARGIATGANEFFVLKKSEISKLDLCPEDYTPCITKSAQIKKPIFTEEDFQTLSAIDAPVYLFNVGNRHSMQASAYIRYGEEHGMNNGYLTQNRTPWYKMERREPAPIMLNVFSREGYKVVRNTSCVQSLTTFHCFYPNLLGWRRIDVLFLYLLSNVGHQILSSSMRNYGNKLNKFEPNDLNKAFVPSESFFDNISPDVVRGLMEKVATGEDVMKEIDSLFMQLVG